jgi:hypothetical protein
MLNGARIPLLLLLSALSASVVPACGRSYRPADRDAVRSWSATDGQGATVFRSQTSHVTWPISSSSNG